jgi:DNA (cytosine-5)-methyltransferase 1
MAIIRCFAVIERVGGRLMNDLYAVELFSGAGGLSLGLNKAGFKVVLANEIERDFAKTYVNNHTKTKMLNDDIRKINFKKELQKLNIKKISLVSGGPPCQGFSTLGSKNEKDNRNNLFYEFLRVVAELNPNYVIFENVAGFKTMYQGKVYKELLSKLDKLGFNSTTTILDVSDFGLPQKRLRTIILAWKKELNKVFLPTATHLFGKISLIEAISDLPPIKTNGSSQEYHQVANNYQKKLRGNCQMLTEHNAANYGAKMQEILSLVPQGGSINDLPKRLRPKSYFSNTYARLLPGEVAPTITRNFGTPSSSRCIHPFQNRALSTREGARLQGFPDNYAFYGSKTSKNLQIGNAVPPVLGEVIGRQIITSMQYSVKQKIAN